MACRICGSEQQKAFPSEINVHPPRGLKYLTSPCVFAFPKLLVCLNCGFTEFALGETERAALRRNYSDEKLVAEGEQSTRISGELRSDDLRVD